MSINMGQLGARFSAASDKMSPVSKKKLDLLAQVGVGYVKDEIQNMHAVDTGTMLNSTTAEEDGEWARLVGPTVFYAPYVALGTSVMVARPFHIVAAHRLEQDIRDFITPEDLGL